MLLAVWVEGRPSSKSPCFRHLTSKSNLTRFPSGMLLNRGSAADYDSWEALGNEGWGWDGLYPYFIKSSQFDPPSPAAAAEFNMTWGEDSYSEDGPIHLSFSSWQFPGIKAQREAIIQAGAEPQVDGQDGHAYGVFWYPTALDNTTARRSYAVNGYYEPAKARENLHVLTGYRVDNLEFDDDKKVTGAALTQRVQGSGTPNRANVGVNLEAVVAAGAMHSPQVLQRSGIGPSWLLDQAGIDVISDLPGVGSNLQDHAVSSAFYICKYCERRPDGPSMLTSPARHHQCPTKPRRFPE